MSDLRQDIIIWSRETFPNRNPSSMIIHLAKEVEELDASWNEADNEFDFDYVKEELADIQILFWCLLDFIEVDQDELLDAIHKKFKILKTRKWGEADEDGVIEHVRE